MVESVMDKIMVMAPELAAFMIVDSAVDGFDIMSLVKYAPVELAYHFLSDYLGDYNPQKMFMLDDTAGFKEALKRFLLHTGIIGAVYVLLLYIMGDVKPTFKKIGLEFAKVAAAGAVGEAAHLIKDKMKESKPELPTQL